MTGIVNVYAVVKVPVHVAGETVEDLITGALLSADLGRKFGPRYTGQIVRYDVGVRRPDGAEESHLFHDKDHLDVLHSEHVQGAEVFDFDAVTISRLNQQMTENNAVTRD